MLFVLSVRRNIPELRPRVPVRSKITAKPRALPFPCAWRHAHIFPGVYPRNANRWLGDVEGDTESLVVSRG